MRNILTVAVGCTLLAACAATRNQGVDVRPVGQGLEFLGMSGVLAALILVFGRLIGPEGVKWCAAYSVHIMFGLFVILAVIMSATAAPYLLMPLLTFLAAVAALVLIIWLLR